MPKVFTVGHSNHELDRFLALLLNNGVTAVADVRSIPASKFTPQFNREALRRALRSSEIEYVFLGTELGARSKDPSCYVDGRVQFDRLAKTELFRTGISRLQKGTETQSIAIMCAEQEPLDCHRTILVSKYLVKQGTDVVHIHGDGILETHSAAMTRLAEKFGLDQVDLLHTQEELEEEAMQRQEEKIAFTTKVWTIH